MNEKQWDIGKHPDYTGSSLHAYYGLSLIFTIIELITALTPLLIRHYKSDIIVVPSAKQPLGLL